MFSRRRIPVKQLALFVVAVVALTLFASPSSAWAAANVTTTANAVRVSVTLLGATSNVFVPATANASGVTSQNHNLVTGSVPGVLQTGVVSTSAGPAGGGAKAEGKVAGLNLLGTTLAADAIGAVCQMTPDELTGSVTTTNLKLLNAPVNVDAQGRISLAGVLTAKINYQDADWNKTTGELTYTVRAIDLDLLGGLGGVAGTRVILGEAICKGTVKLGTVTRTPASMAPGQSGTPIVTVSNTGEVAAPNTTIRIPKPDPDFYTLDAPTVSGVGSCDKDVSPTHVVCTGVTVPGGGTSKVSLPVTLKSSAPGTGVPPWSPAAGSITAETTPIAGDAAESMTISGGGNLASGLARSTTGGTITVNATTLAAGKTAPATIKIANAGPSDASGATVTIPIANAPTGVQVTSASSTSGSCTVDSSNVICTNVNVAAGPNQDVTITLNTAATVTAPPNSTWDLANITTSLNNRAISGYGRLLRVTDPDVNLDSGVSITPAVATAGGAKVNATVKINNVGAQAASNVTVTFPPAPAGYTFDLPNATGGTCGLNNGAVRCTAVSVPAATAGSPGSRTLTVPVTLSAAATANWTGTVTAATTDSTGTATGTLVSASVRANLSAVGRGPAARTVSPGQPTTMTVDVSNQGPSNAVNEPFVVVAPQGSTFGTLPADLQSRCQTLSPTTLRCRVTLTPTDAPLSFDLPLQVSAQADAATPLTGGCASLDDNSTCGGAADVPLPSITLRAALADRLALLATPATVTPGSSGTGKITLTSAQAESGLKVTVPKNALPGDFTVTGATIGGGVCDTSGASIVCTGVPLAANVAKDLEITVAVAATNSTTQTWTATGITVEAGDEQITRSGALATTGSPAYELEATVGTVPAGTVEPTGTANVPVTVTNKGPSNAPNATFTVTAPNGTTFGALNATTAGICGADAGRTLLTCTTSLNVNATTAALTVPLVIASNADPGKAITGSCVDLDGFPGCGSKDAAIPPITLKVPAAAQIGFASDTVTVTPGEDAIAKLRVSSTRSATLTGTVVKIPLALLPADLTVPAVTLAGGTVCPIAGNEATCTIPQIIPGTPQEIHVRVEAEPDAAKATWTANNITATIAAGTVTAADQVLAQIGDPVNEVTATVNPPGTPILPGRTGIVTVDVNNAGPSDAVGTTVTVIAPNGATFGALTPGSPTGNACQISGDWKSASCTFDQAAADPATRFTFPVVVAATVQAGTGLTGGCVDLDGNDICTSTDGVFPPIPIDVPLQGRLTVTTTPATVVPGAAGAATATLTLRSATDLDDLKVSTGTVVPTGLVVTGVTAPGNLACTAQADGVFNCGDVDMSGSGSSWTADITVTMTAAATADPVSWTPALTITTADLSQTAAATGTLAIIGAAQPTLTATTSVPGSGTVNPGETTSVTVTVANSGPSAAKDRAVVVTAPTGTTFGSPLPANCQSIVSNRVQCRVDVAVNGTAAVNLPVAVPGNADLFTDLTGGCVDFDGVAPCDAPIDPIVLRVPVDRRAAVTVTPVTVTPGTTGSATVRVSAENGALTNFTVEVPMTLGTGLTLGPITPGPACAASTATKAVCTWASMAKGVSHDITIPVIAAPGAAESVPVTATGIKITDDAGAVTLAGSRQVAVTAAPQFTLSAATGPITPIEPGGPGGTVSITVTDTGPSDATAATFSVLAPAGVTFGTPLPSGCAVDGPKTRLSCTASVLKAGPALNLPVPVVVAATADPGTPISGLCFDRNDNGACAAPVDQLLADIPLTTRFDQEVTVRAERAALNPGGDTKAGKLVISSTKAQPVDVVIPTGDLPLNWAAAPTAPCTAGANQINCTVNLDGITDTEIVFDVTSPGGSVAGETWEAKNIAVTGRTGAATITMDSLLALVGTTPYVLSATVSGVPQDGTVLPGATVPLTVTVTNSTRQHPTIKAPVVVTAPTGTTFGTPLPSACVPASPTTLNCRTVVNSFGVVATWALPIVVAANAIGGFRAEDGCVDLDSTGSTCEVLITSFTVRPRIAAVVTVDGSSTAATPVPGGTGTGTINLASSAVRNGLEVAVSLAGLPSGVDVTDVSLGGGTCVIATGTATCPPTDFSIGNTPLIVSFSTGPGTAAGASWRPAITVTDPGQDSVVLRTTALTTGAADARLAVALVLPADGSVLPGGTADIQVTLSNGGVSDNPGGQAIFTAPAGTTFQLAGTPAAAFCTTTSATQIACTTNLPAGAENQFQLQLKVAGTATGGAVIAGGCAKVPTGVECDEPIAFTLGKPFADQARLSFQVADVVPGAIGSGFVKVTADRVLTGLSVTVPLLGKPADVEIAGASVPGGAACTVNSSEIHCSGITLAVGSQTLIDVRLQPASHLPAGVTWSPVATLSNGSGGTSQGDGLLLRTLAPVPDVRYTMTAPTTPVAPGGPAVITGTLDNRGFSDLTNATVRVKAPTGTTFGTPLPTGCIAVGNALLDCTLTLPAGAPAPLTWSLPIQIPANADPSTPVDGGCVDLDRDNVCDIDEPKLPEIRLTATLAQAITIRTPLAGGADLTPGVTGTVTIVVASTQAGSGLTVTIPTDGLPTGMEIVQVRSDAGSCVPGPRAVTCSNVSVPTGGTADVVLTALVAGNAPSGTWSPTVLVSQGSQSKETQVTGAATVGAPRTDVKVTVGVPADGTVLPGGTGTLTLIATNDGPSQAGALNYAVIAPTGTSFPPLAGPAAGACTRVSGTLVTCGMTVAGNGRAQVALPITVDPTASSASPLTGGCVRSTPGSTCAAPSTPIANITLATPLSGKLQIAGVPATVAPGRTGSGVLRVTSAGTVTGAVVTIPLAGKPAAFTVTGVSGPQGSVCSPGPTEIRCTGVNLTNGVNAAVTVTTRVDPGAAAAVPWRATGITVVAGGETATASADLIVSGDPVAAVTFRPATPSSTVKPGETTTLTVAVSNAGPSNATRRTATLIAPDNTRFGTPTGTAAQACTVTSASVLTCTYDLAVNESATWTVPLLVSAGVRDGDKLTGGCVSADGNKTCGGDLDVSIDGTPVNDSISETGSLSLDSAVIPAGESGTAVVRFSATAAHKGLTLTVPLAGLPDGFSVKTATIGGAACTVGSTTVRCTGVDLVAGQPRELSLGVDVASGTASGAQWWAAGITLADPDDADDKLTTSGLLVSIVRPDYAVSVTVGSPSVTSPAPGQTTVLPISLANAGPGNADPYVATIRLPEGMGVSTLPSGCVAGSAARTVVCSVSLPAGTSKLIELPLTVSTELTGGETLTGGCVDEALSSKPEPDGACDGDGDVAIPSIPVIRHKVNLAVVYDKPAVTLSPGTKAVIRVPYSNEGTEMADDVKFTVRPPAGVLIRSAAVLFEETAAETVSAETAASTVPTACAAAGGTAAANVVVCEAPDAAALEGSELWLTVDASNSARSGVRPMWVTVSTSSADGNATDNTVEVMLRLATAAADGDDGDGGGSDDGGKDDEDLPTTGPQVVGMVLTSFLMIVAGVTLMMAMRRPGAAAATGTRTPVVVQDYQPRHALVTGRPRRRTGRQPG